MRARILIAGGGVGALEAALALKALAWERADITLLAPERHFTYRPLWVGEPFAAGQAVRFELAAVAAERGFELVRDAIDSVDPDARVVRTQDGVELGYDVLLMALGARAVAAVPGALTFRGPRSTAEIGESLRELPAGAHVGFVAPLGATWTLPLYELAFLCARWSQREGRELRVSVVTPEHRPLAIFGEAAGEAVERLAAERDVGLRLASVPNAAAFDLTVALPELCGPWVSGLPADRDGFVEVDSAGRVKGLDGVYAVGDMTAGPVKQGGLATQQADAAAAAIAAELGCIEPRPVEPPVLRGMLLTGDEPLFLRNPPVAREDSWWPPHKILGRHLSPYVAANAHLARVAA